MKKNYCPTCDSYTKTTVVSKKESFNVKGEDIKIESSVLVCDTCKEDIFDEILDERNLELAYTAYRKKHNLLSPVKIKEIREKYGLSQRALSRLLGWGEITVHRYESGAIQDAPHNDILRFILNPENMLEIYKYNNQLLSSNVRVSLKKRIDELINNETEPRLMDRYLSANKKIDEFSGYKEFDLEKMINIILCVINNYKKGVYKTKINKLLWYIDFVYFKKFSVSISGSTYIHFQYGPVPENYEIFQTVASCDTENFSKSEIETMDFVINYFKNYNCNEISQFSHKEKAYKNTTDNEMISYNYASELSLTLP